MSKDYNHPNLYGAEGADHINISSRSETHLGKLFDPSYFKTVNYPQIGKFASVMNLWYWLRTDPVIDALRRASGDKLRKLIATGKSGAYVPNFHAIIALATYEKIKAYPEAVQEIKKLSPEIRLLSYYIPQATVLRVCSNYANVIVPIAEMICEAIRSDQEPDFTKLLNQPTDISHHYLSPFLKARLPSVYERLQAEPVS